MALRLAFFVVIVALAACVRAGRGGGDDPGDVGHLHADHVAERKRRALTVAKPKQRGERLGRPGGLLRGGPRTPGGPTNTCPPGKEIS